MPSRKAVPLKAEEIPPDRDWYDWLERLQSHFGRFSWDLGGILLLAFSLMTLLALTGLTRGLLLTAWSAVLQRWSRCPRNGSGRRDTAAQKFTACRCPLGARGRA
jgi:hypothetical protein